jgi:hypothetical protein
MYCLPSFHATDHEINFIRQGNLIAVLSTYPFGRKSYKAVLFYLITLSSVKYIIKNFSTFELAILICSGTRGYYYNKSSFLNAGQISGAAEQCIKYVVLNTY